MPSATSSTPTSEGTSTAFKDQIDRALVARLAEAFGRVDDRFDAARFRRAAVRGLAALELKGRIAHVAAALGASLPTAFPEAVAVVDAVFAPRRDESGTGLSGWDVWPMVEWVALAGRDHPDAALELLARLTRHASAEFAVRPFIDDDPDGVHRRLERWAAHEDEHVRRLVSEGTRPKLPWGSALRITATDPAYAVDVLDRLVDDPSEYVRRSVSNHLNDLCRVDPDLALRVAGRWCDDATPTTHVAREWVVRRGLRTLVKAGDARAMRLLGHDPDVAVEAALQVRTPVVRLGGAAEWTVRLTSLEADEHRLVLDYAVHHVRADGSTGRKVSKWTTVTLGGGSTVELSRRHRIVPVTVRTYHPGEHLIEVQVNGVVVASGAFDLQVDPASG